MSGDAFAVAWSATAPRAVAKLAAEGRYGGGQWGRRWGFLLDGMHGVSDYHRAQLGALVAHVGEAVDRYRAGELDAFEVDRVLFQYSRAARELWKFCNYLRVEVAASTITERPPQDWWERGAPRER